ncbi:MAG: DAK2 domain-containing protein [Defluviitaleaceae bacterium]|nr:DAK2 domain-containing protein [Defluviitaleaceae bacterium]MCL2239441.1 DAK2 domain-containing protein [Defluviitaleaceae bacterium]
MGLITIDGGNLRKMIIGGANELIRNIAPLNALNVFPVPDGDTGTNMSHTVQAAAREVAKLSNPNIADVAKAASNGALRGARGNSGVILSQLFRGFSKGLEGKATAKAADLAAGLSKSSEMAYKAVMKPKEGTMLTIGRAFAEAAHEVAFDQKDIEICLRFVIEQANEVLAKTPDMLPALKEAGVVDSGGMGLIFFLQGALDAMGTKGDIELLEITAQSGEVATAAIGPMEITFPYCTEFLLELAAPDKRKPGHSPDVEATLKTYLSGIGDSIVVIEDAGLVKVHVHTSDPGKALQKALQFGELHDIKIDNMREQHTGMLDFSASQPASLPTAAPKSIGVVSVASGAGLRDLFIGLGADVCIEGGQSMNPSTEDIVQAIAKVNAQRVIVLPNNKNIVLTAQQAAKLTTDKEVRVMATLSIPQGMACMVANSDTISLEENLAGMKEAMEAVHCGQITRAVRDTVMDGHTILEGDILCLYDGDIVIVEKFLHRGAKALADYMLERGGDIVTLYHGEGATAETATELSAYIAKKYPHTEVEVYEGKQPLYSYILSVE